MTERLYFHCIIVSDLIQVILEWSSGFPYFLQFKSEFCNEEFMTSQLLVLLLLTVQSFSFFGCKEYNKSDFGIDHLVTSMYIVYSCVVGRRCCYDWCILLAKLYQLLPCFILYSNGKFACYSRYLLTSYFCIPVPYNEKDIFGGVSSRSSCRSSQNHSSSAAKNIINLILVLTIW